MHFKIGYSVNEHSHIKTSIIYCSSKEIEMWPKLVVSEVAMEYEIDIHRV